MVLQHRGWLGTYHAGIIHEPVEKGAMRVPRTVRASSLAALAALLVGSSAFAQVDGPASTPPPIKQPDVTTALLRSELTDPVINRIIEEAAAFAHSEIGGRVRSYRSELLPGRGDVVLAARDIADETLEADAERPIDLVLMSGGDSQATSNFARAYIDTNFIDIDQPLPCLTPDGQADPDGVCAGGLAAIPPNQITVGFDADQAAYLAGIIAASASRNDRLGIISGTPDCPNCNQVIEGFVRGAQSVSPDIDVQVAYLADEASYEAEGGEVAAFGDMAAARTFARAFIDVYEPDVVLPLAGAASRGVIDAVCSTEATLAIGSDFDVAAAYPDLAECVLTSIAKDYEYAVREAVFAYTRGDLVPDRRLGLDDDRVTVTDEWRRRPGLTAGLPTLYEQAHEGILTGAIRTCDEDCGAPFDTTAGSDAEDQPEPEPVSPEPDEAASPAP
jgi:basic membrane lipoprotein Med (substrate-binding protein (PBP1-ABC) superfamily)